MKSLVRDAFTAIVYVVEVLVNPHYLTGNF